MTTSKQYINVADSITTLSGMLDSLMHTRNTLNNEYLLDKVMKDPQCSRRMGSPVTRLYGGSKKVMDEINVLIDKMQRDGKERNSGNSHTISVLQTAAYCLNLVDARREKAYSLVLSARKAHAATKVSDDSAAWGEFAKSKDGLEFFLREANKYLDYAIENLENATQLAKKRNVYIIDYSDPVANTDHKQLEGSSISRLIGDMSTFNATEQSSSISPRVNEVAGLNPMLVAATV